MSDERSFWSNAGALDVEVFDREFYWSVEAVESDQGWSMVVVVGVAWVIGSIEKARHGW